MLQPSSGSTRERWIKALLPTAAIVAVYTLLVIVSSSRELTRLRKELADEQKRAVTEDVLFQLNSQRVSATRERDRLQDQIESARKSVEQTVEQFAGRSATERMARVGQLCRESSISVLEQKPADQLQLSKLREASLQELRKLVPGDGVRYQQLELFGRYTEMETLLRRLPAEVRGVVPLAIELLEENSESSAVSSGQRRWRVYLML